MFRMKPGNGFQMQKIKFTRIQADFLRFDPASIIYLERPNQNHLFPKFCQQYILAQIFDNLEYRLCHPWVYITLYINLAQITLIWLDGLGLVGLVTHRLL